MLDDFTPIIHTLEGREIKVWAVGDVHIGAKECDLQGFKKFLGKIEDDPDSYLVIVGDVLNNGIKSSVSDYEDMSPGTQIDVAVDLLTPVSDKILGCVGGNHERRSKKSCDLDPLFDVFAIMRKPELYRPNLGFVRIILERGRTKNRYALLLMHGKTANKKRQFDYQIEGIDASIGGHLHAGSIEKLAKLQFTAGNRVKIKPIISLTATSWLKFGGYAANNLYLGKAISDPQCLILGFSGTNDYNGEIRVGW